MRPFLPPDSRALRDRVVSRNGRRLARVAAEIAERAASRDQREAARALISTLRSLRGAARADFLTGPGVRAWIASTEDAVLLLRTDASVETIFEIASRGPHLRRLMPHGRIDASFRRRTAALGREVLDRAYARIPALVAFLTPSGESFSKLPIDAVADAEEGRIEGEVHLAFPAPLSIRRVGGTRLTLLPHAIKIHQGRSSPHVLPRTVIRGSPIVLARRTVSTRSGLRAGAYVRGLEERLGEALALVRDAWPEAHDEILEHTIEVVPLVERGTVSYSLPERPGTSFINVWGKSLVDLADDLLHETAHHRLHGLEEIEGPLDRDDGEPRYWSPWRRSIRPVHGILHATYTFAWRAELLSRMASSGCAPISRRKLRREAEREWSRVGRSLDDLKDAMALGLLTPAGVALVHSIAARVKS